MGLPTRPSAAEIAAGTGANKRLWTPADIKAMIDAHGGGSVSIEDEGELVPGAPHTTLDFVGDGVTASNAGGGKATITIPGGSGGVDQFSYVSERWYTADPHGAVQVLFGTTTSRIQNGRLGAVPIRVKEAFTLDASVIPALGVLLQGGPSGTTGNVRVGIWEDAGGIPGDKIADSEEIAVVLGSNVVGFLIGAMDVPAVVIPQGIIWIGGIGDLSDNTRARGVFTPSGFFLELGWDATRLNSQPGVDTGGIVGFIDTNDVGRSTAVALPDPFPVDALTMQDRKGGAQGYILTPHFLVD